MPEGRYSTFPYPDQDPYQDPCSKDFMRTPYSTYKYASNVSFYFTLLLIANIILLSFMGKCNFFKLKNVVIGKLSHLKYVPYYMGTIFLVRYSTSPNQYQYLHIRIRIKIEQVKKTFELFSFVRMSIRIRI